MLGGEVRVASLSRSWAKRFAIIIPSTRREKKVRFAIGISLYPILARTHTHTAAYTRATCLVYLVHTRKRKHGLRVGRG